MNSIGSDDIIAHNISRLGMSVSAYAVAPSKTLLRRERTVGPVIVAPRSCRPCVDRIG